MQRLKYTTLPLLLLILFYAPSRSSSWAQEAKKTAREPDLLLKTLTKQTAKDTLYTIRKFNFIEAVVSLPTDSTLDLSFILNTDPAIQLYLTPDELQKISPAIIDPIEQQLRRRYLDLPPMARLNGLLGGLAKAIKKTIRRPPGELTVPRDEEIEILKILWAHSISSSSDIYAELDSKIRLTAEDLQNVLAEMTKRGFLGREKISPSHDFEVFGLFSFELSGKNARNELYVYWPLIGRQRLITYLDAKRYLAYERSLKYASNGHHQTYHKYLAAKLNRLTAN